MSLSQHKFQQRLLEFIEVCNDGYAILTADDKMLGCNQGFAGIFYQDQRKIQGLSFDQLIRLSFSEGKGIRFETETIDEWLAQVQQKRRQNPFQLFEVNLTDDRWFLMSETDFANG